MQIRITLTGTTPLLQHNIRLADPDDEITKAIKEVTSKRKKTEDDRKDIEMKEWIGGLYMGEIDGKNTIVEPTGNVRKAFIEAARVSKLGKQVERGLSFTSLHTPLAFRGSDTIGDITPKALESMYQGGAYKNRVMVGLMGKRVVRVRPSFQPWALTADAFLLTEVLDIDDLVRIVELAGQATGLGDNRVNGYGRFTASVTAY